MLLHSMPHTGFAIRFCSSNSSHDFHVQWISSVLAVFSSIGDPGVEVLNLCRVERFCMGGLVCWVSIVCELHVGPCVRGLVRVQLSQCASRGQLFKVQQFFRMLAGSR